MPMWLYLLCVLAILLAVVGLTFYFEPRKAVRPKDSQDEQPDLFRHAAE